MDKKKCQQCRYRKWLWHSRWGISISSGRLCTQTKVIFKLAASYLRRLFLVFEYFAKPAPAPDAGFFRWQISDCRIRSWVPQPTAALAATIKSLISLLYLPTTHYCHRRQLSSSWIPTMSLLSPSGEPQSSAKLILLTNQVESRSMFPFGERYCKLNLCPHPGKVCGNKICWCLIWVSPGTAS